jgi:hypothetical protein
VLPVRAKVTLACPAGTATSRDAGATAWMAEVRSAQRDGKAVAINAKRARTSANFKPHLLITED